MKIGFPAKVLAALLFLFLCGCSDTKHLAQPGDHLQADFTCRLADRSLVETTLAQVAGDDSAVKSPIFSLRDNYRPLKFAVTETSEKLQGQPFDPLEQKIGMAIANRANELSLDHATPLQLQNLQIENYPPGDRFLEMAMKVTMPRTKEMPLAEFEARYGSAPPVIGAVVGQDSEYPGIIRAIGKEAVTIYFSTRKGTKIPMALVSAFIREKDDENFEVTMDVHEGQLIQRLGGLPGRVTAVDREKFTIDFGQSFAGETLFCDVTARPHDPLQETKASPINWIEDFDEGLKLARQQGKPVVLFLYSDGCPYCRQMQDKVFPDPSLGSVKNSFVWLKINSEKRTEYAERFDQQGYPLTLVLNSVGSELEKLSGLQHVATLAYKLDSILSKKKKS